MLFSTKRRYLIQTSDLTGGIALIYATTQSFQETRTYLREELNVYHPDSSIDMHRY